MTELKLSSEGALCTRPFERSGTIDPQQRVKVERSTAVAAAWRSAPPAERPLATTMVDQPAALEDADNRAAHQAGSIVDVMLNSQLALSSCARGSSRD
jgi:hypothetical protein